MKLTKRSIDGFHYQGDGHSRDVRWDSAVRGLGLRVYPSGRKAFVLSYRIIHPPVGGDADPRHGERTWFVYCELDAHSAVVK